jgi:hypothetical protein
MSLAVKIIISFLLFFSSTVHSKTIKILVIGQSISSNCNEHIYGKIDGIFQIDLDGSEKPAEDPFFWADCKAGSMWLPLGNEIIKSGMSDHVVFMPIGVAGIMVSDWRTGGRAFRKLEKAISLIKKNNIHFDYAFWHQGSSDIGGNPNSYEADLKSVLRYISLNIQVKKWLIAQHSSCFGKTNIEIEKRQIWIGSRYLYRRFQGPNTNLLDASFRVDGCHLNRAGQEKMAQLWLASMQNADRLDSVLQKESLLYYFK